MSSTIELNIFAIVAGVTEYKLIIKKRKKKHDEIVLSAKFKLDYIKSLISRSLIISYISVNDIYSINNVLKIRLYEKWNQNLMT